MRRGGPATSGFFQLDGLERRADVRTVSPRVRRAVLASTAVVWAAAIGLGLYAMFTEATTRGATAASPERWPPATRLVRGAGATIAMFVHPGCPCSRASIGELAEIARAARIGPASSLAIEIVVAGPDPTGASWDVAGALPGAIRIVDDGREAARFGARTSGYTVVYDRDGILRFSGGITGSRGHAGDNVGRAAVQRLAAGQDSEVRSHAVFGCALGGAP